MGRVGGRFFAAFATAATLLALAALPAGAPAAVTTTAKSPQHVFVAGDDAADTIRIECVQGQLRVNGADPPQGAVGCSTLIKLEVTGGGGDDVLDLSRVDYRLTALRKLKKPLKSSVDGGEGNDQVVAGASVETVIGGPGADSLTSIGGVLLRQMTGGPGPDVMQGGGISELLAGGPGRDTIMGGGSTDLLIGGKGADRIHGDRGGDILAGASGADLISGGLRDDALVGGKGLDRLIGGPGNDVKVHAGRTKQATLAFAFFVLGRLLLSLDGTFSDAEVRARQMACALIDPRTGSGRCG